MGGIYWISSYPRSGNTWFRTFLSKILSGKNGTALDINNLCLKLGAASRAIFDEFSAMESSEMTTEETELLRPKVFEYMANSFEHSIYIKIHDAYTRNSENIPIVSVKATLGAVYIIRNPLDVAVSCANYFAEGMDKTIRLMADNRRILSAKPKEMKPQFPQRLMSWSNHVLSWVDVSDTKVHVIRYEDMLLRPLETFKGALSFLGIQPDQQEIEDAFKQSSFEKLKKQEEKYGFSENWSKSIFFREGKIGSWKDVLTSIQKSAIIRTHEKVMKRFNYLDTNGEVIS